MTAVNPTFFMVCFHFTDFKMLTTIGTIMILSFINGFLLPILKLPDVQILFFAVEYVVINSRFIGYIVIGI